MDQVAALPNARACATSLPMCGVRLADKLSSRMGSDHPVKQRIDCLDVASPSPAGSFARRKVHFVPVIPTARSAWAMDRRLNRLAPRSTPTHLDGEGTDGLQQVRHHPEHLVRVCSPAVWSQ